MPEPEHVCLSGGAAGADTIWGEAATQVGMNVIHWEFERHKSAVPTYQRHFLTQAELDVADPYLAKANETLGRRWPISNQYVANLLRRNYYQVAWSDAVYAVSTFERGLVAGGTAWATTMFCDRFASDDGPQACFVYDQIRRQWAQWDGEGFLLIDRPPPPTGVWAGIGTRDINPAGVAAIHDLMGIAQ